MAFVTFCERAFKTISARQKLGEDWANDGANVTPEAKVIFDKEVARSAGCSVVDSPQSIFYVEDCIRQQKINSRSLGDGNQIPSKLERTHKEIVISGLSTGVLAAQAISALVAGTREVKEKKIHYTTLGDSNVDVLPSEHTASKLVSSSPLSSEESVTLELSSKLAIASMSCSVFTSFGCRFLRLASGFLALDLGLELGFLSWLDGGGSGPRAS
ncbi:hypothetical protein PF010_g26615 [Phytophthora fragariae]|uniref:Uncharacterized protein n=1 Tax=Phytophthora fragariae TaxID=53985 RepID=A0A6G0QFJ3_9STRA|nr:hypothetical protein PF010_g26615 [Phytophthora fragariae]KAE9285295.1 hypothetical protein PF008_g26950 [Phytophthora fragariae]